jgi:hypothetical protein
MKKSDFRPEEFFEFKLNTDAMNKLRGGDGPTPPIKPPEEPAGK